MIAMPDPTHVRDPAVAPGEDGDGVARMFADVLTPGAPALRGRPAPRPAPRRGAHARHGLRPLLRRRPSSSTSSSATTAAPRSSTRAATSTSRRSTPAPTCAARPSSRSSSSASRSSTPTTRSGRRQHEIDMRYADALKMADDCMTYRITVKEYAMKYGWHATFMPKPLFGENGSGMHTHQSLFKDERNAFYDAGRQVLPLRRRQGVHRRPAAPRARDLLDLRPVGELLQAARAGLRGAGLRRLVAPQPLARSCACRSTTPARSARRAWSCAAPTRRATRT